MKYFELMLIEAHGNLLEVERLLSLHKVLAKGKGAGGYEVLWRGTKKPRPK